MKTAVIASMSNIFRVSVSVYIMVLSFIIINLAAGPGGIAPYNELEEYRKSLVTNIGELESINKKLQIESERLIHDSDEIKVKARELGWIDYDEGLIIVKGYRYTQAGYSMGKLLSHEKKYQDRTTVYRLAALMIGVLFYILSSLIRKENFIGLKKLK